MSPRQELRYAARALRRSPVTSWSIVATLAICIAAVAAVYSVVDVVLVRGLPYRDSRELIWVSSVSQGRADRPFSLPEFMDYRAETRSVRVGGYSSWSGILQTSTGSLRLQGLRVSAGALSILGATPTLGRLLSVDDDAPGAPRAIMLGYGWWRRELAGDPDVVGRTLAINGEPWTVVGVLPRFLPLSVRDVEAVVPLNPEADPRRNARGSVNFIRMIGRLAPGVTAASAERELDAVRLRLRERFPREYAAKIGVRVTPLRDYLATTQRPTLVILLVCVALMVAVALANVLTLILARAVAREGETAVRLAFGASLRRIAVQLLAEGALLVLAAAGIGVVLAQLAIAYAAGHLAAITPRIEEARLSVPVLGLVLAVCAVAVLLFSVLPVLFARAVAPQTALRAAGRSGSSSPTQARVRSAFVVAEIAFAVVITSATLALAQSLIALQRVELGFRPDSVFVARLSLPPVRYVTPADVARFTTAMESALAQTPGVAAAGATSIAPLSGLLSAVPFAPADHPPAERRDWPAANYRAISPGYLGAIGARMLAGRPIGDRDDSGAPPAAVVNRALAQKYFIAEDVGDAGDTGGSELRGVVGRDLMIDDNNVGERRVTIVGVVDDVREVDLDGPVAPEVFVALEQLHPDQMTFTTANQFWAVRLRGGAEAGAFAPNFARVLRDVDAGVAMAGSMDLRGYVDATIAPRLFSVRLLAAFTLIALLLTTVGVYGISTYVVEQRRREIGVRLALGATPVGIVRLMLGRTLRLAAIGVALGILGAFAASGFMARLMFGVSPGSPILLGAVGALLLGTALVASWLPGRRASRLDPSLALASE